MNDRPDITYLETVAGNATREDDRVELSNHHVLL